MTIATSSNKSTWQGNGATTVFSFSFEIGSASQASLFLSSGGSVTLIPPTSYRLSGLGSPSGGTVTYPLSGAPIPQGATLALIRTVSLQQLTDLVNQSNYFPDAVEGALDYEMMALQQISQQVNYSLQTPVSDPVLNLTFPNAAARASQLAGFDVNGNVILYPITASVGAGNMTPELGSNGRPGFKAGTDFTVGNPSILNLSKAYGSVGNVFAAWDGVYQERDSYQIVGNQIQFGSWVGSTFVVGTWPSGITNVDIVGGTTLSIGIPAQGVITDSMIAPGSKVFNRGNDTVWITDFGGSATSSDNSAALLAAIAACPTDRIRVYIPAGVWKFAGNVTYNAPSVHTSLTILGAGSDSTELQWATGGGFTFNALGKPNSIHIRDLAMTTGTTGTGNALTLNGPTSPFDSALPAQSDITNVTFRGADGYQLTNYWANCIRDVCFHNINFANCQFIGPSGVGGNGLNVNGSAANPAIVFNFTACSFNHLSSGIFYGNQTQGITVSQCNFTAAVGVGTSNGIISDQAATQGSLVQLSVTGSQFTVNTDAIFLPVGVTGTNINDNFIYVPPGAFGINIQGALYTITGNNIIGQSVTGTTGIKITNTLGPGVITGNQLNSLATAILLDTSCSNCNVQSNAYGSNTANVTNNGTLNTVGGGSQ